MAALAHVVLVALVVSFCLSALSYVYVKSIVRTDIWTLVQEKAATDGRWSSHGLDVLPSPPPATPTDPPPVSGAATLGAETRADARNSRAKNPDGPKPTQLPVRQSLPHGNVFKLEIVNKFPHDSSAYTQGLLYLGHDTLYESIGLYGQSEVRKVDLRTGHVLARTKNQARDFGEGLAYYQGFFWQLIWKQRTVYKYDAKTLALLGTFSLPSGFDHVDGWGLASSSDGLEQPHAENAIPRNEHLYVTDSGTKLYKIEFVDGAFKLINSTTVRNSHKIVEMPNELELVSDDDLWANIYGNDCIARINPRTGQVFGWILGHDLRKHSLGPRAEVFNGIAYDRQGHRTFLTGKLWNTMFEVKLVPWQMSATDVERLCVPTSNIFHRRHR